ncbi:MAG: lycopene cyclase family protein [Cyanobacteriota bacterium]|nr:lycopene cyclase family protein [Cyanobacteriota bacterium]
MPGEGTPTWSGDVLVIGAGPAALSIAAELAALGVGVAGLAPDDPAAPWPNTYGIWTEEVDALGLGHLLSHRWSNTVSYFGPATGEGTGSDGLIRHGRDYGLFDKAALQQHWLEPCGQAGICWHRGQASAIHHEATASIVSTSSGEILQASLVVDATGHDPVFVVRGSDGPVAGQAAYGIVGRFSADPIAQGQFVFMDYRPDHLSEAERLEPPTFLYAMDLGEGVFFVEETSLALAPPVPFPSLQARLHKRLAHRGVEVREVLHEEFCLFPMNPPLPDLRQRVVGFGGAGGLVHPASGYMVGSLLRRAPDLAKAIAGGLQSGLRGQELAEAAWLGLWTPELRWKHAFFRFGLEKLMRFDEARLRHHFSTFFQLPLQQWSGFLSNTLPPPDLLQAMVALYRTAPWDVRWGLMGLRGREGKLLLAMLSGWTKSAADLTR